VRHEPRDRGHRLPHARLRLGDGGGPDGGGVHESTVIGTAGDTIARLDLPEEERERLQNNIPVAYAVTYLVGTGFVVWFLSSLAPKLLRIDLKAEARALEEKLSMRKESGGVELAYREWGHRAYRVGGTLAGRSVSDVERSASPARVFIERVRRGAGLLDAATDLVLQPGDIIAVTARRHVFLDGTVAWGEEVEDRELLEFPVATLDVVVTRKEIAGRPLASIAEEHGRGVALVKLVRAGQEIPFTAETEIDRGDLLRIAGSRRDVERAGRVLGYVERPTSETDVVFVGLGIFLGGLLGAMTISVAGLPLSLTASGGALIMGLIFGWLRSVRPTFGRIPEPALWVFDTIGLAVFIGVVGLNAGPTFVDALKKTGPSLFLSASSSQRSPISRRSCSAASCCA
jgi:putative transport protein